MLHFCCLHTVLRIRIEFQHNIALHEQGYTWVTSCPVLTRQRSSCVASFGCCCLTDPDRRLTLWSLYLSPARMMRPLFFFFGSDARTRSSITCIFTTHTPASTRSHTRMRSMCDAVAGDLANSQVGHHVALCPCRSADRFRTAKRHGTSHRPHTTAVFLWCLSDSDAADGRSPLAAGRGKYCKLSEETEESSHGHRQIEGTQ